MTPPPPRAGEAVGIAGGDGGDAGGGGGGPGGAVADGFARSDFADLDYRECEGHHGACRGERQAAVEADAGAGEVVVDVGAEEDTAGGGETAADAGEAGGHGGEGVRLGGVHRIVGRVGAGEVAEHEDGVQAGVEVEGGFELGRIVSGRDIASLVGDTLPDL